MQKGGGWVPIACTIAYILNGRPLLVKPKASCVFCCCCNFAYNDNNNVSMIGERVGLYWILGLDWVDLSSLVSLYVI